MPRPKTAALALLVAVAIAVVSVSVGAAFAHSTFNPSASAKVSPASGCSLTAGSGDNGGSGSVTISPTLAVTAGQTVLVAVEPNSGVTVSGSTDGSYSNIVSDNAATYGPSYGLWQATVSTTGCDTITVSGFSGYGEGIAVAFSAGALDQVAYGDRNTYGTSPSLGIGTTNPNEVAVALYLGNTQFNFSAPSGVVNVNAGQPRSGVYTDQGVASVASAGTATFSGTSGVGNSELIGASFAAPPSCPTTTASGEVASGSLALSPIAVVAGQTIVVFTGTGVTGNNMDTNAVPSDGVNSYTNVIASTGAGEQYATGVWYATAASSGCDSITVSGVASGSEEVVADVAVMGPVLGVDVYGTSFSNGAFNTPTLTMTTTTANDLVVGFIYLYSGPITWNSPASLVIAQRDASGSYTSMANETASSVGAVTMTSGGDGGYNMDGVAFLTQAPPSVPPAPTSLSGTPSDTSIAWTWTQATGGGITDNHLYLYSGASCAGSPTAFDMGSPATSYTTTSLTPSTAYSATVTASNSTGEGTASTCAAATTTAAPSAPPAPTGLAGTPTSGTSITWGWTQATGGGITDNHLYLYSGGSCAGSPTSFDLGSAGTSKVTGSLTANTTYSATATATNSTGEGAASSCAAAKTFGVPLPPHGASGGSPTNTAITWTWVLPAGTLTGVTLDLYASTAVCAGSPSATSLSGSATTSTSTGLSSGTTYSVKVIATNSTGSSNPSGCASATTTSPPPPPVGGPAPATNFVFLEQAVILLALVALIVVGLSSMRKRRSKG